MSSLRLTTSLQQRMVLTPQLRQRIEMLQMTSMELSELIEQEMVSNPVLEEVLPGEEVKEISDNILDQNAEGGEFEGGSNFGEQDQQKSTDGEFGEGYEQFSTETPDLNGNRETTQESESSEESSGETESSDPFEEIDYGREFQDYL